MFFLLLPLCSMGVPGQTVDPAQKGKVTTKGEAWQGKWADGTPLTRKKLDEMLAAHREWIKTAPVKFIEEYKAIAQGEYKELIASDWEADQGRLVFKGAGLEGANLRVADLRGANLQGADLRRAILKGTLLWEANMQGANLGEANLQGANLAGANLKGVLYEPEQGALPYIIALRVARHLETLRFIESPHGLEELKQAFKNAGMRQQEREITHAIKQSEHENAWKKGDCFESLVNFVLLDWPVRYGLYPWRALKILGFLIPVFALLYGWAIWRPSENVAIICRIWPKERIEVTGGEVGMADDIKIERLNPKGWRIIPHAFYFSLLSAFHIGWRDLNVGTWITRVQRRPYALHAEGWIRTFSGGQSLISVYLLAIWALTYFGRPFE